MTITTQKWHHLTLCCVAIMAVTMICTYILDRGDFPDSVSDVDIIAENFLGCIICIILFVSIYFVKEVNLSSISLQMMVFFEFVRLISDVNSAVGGGSFGYTIIDEINHYILFCTVPCIFAALWMYIRSMSNLTTTKNTVIDYTFWICYVIDIVLILPNIENCWIYTLDPTSHSFNEYFFSFIVVIALPILEMIMCALLIFTHVSNRKDRIHYLLAIIIPALAIVLQINHPASNNLTAGLLFMVILIYGNTFMNRGYELALKKRSVRDLKQTMYVAQLQPEFVSTTLQKIKNMPGNPPAMMNAIDLFDRYLRNNFKSTEDKVIPFSTELEHVKLYVGLEKLRFKDKLEVKFEINDEDFEIPPLILQMVVENAIKHGITKKVNGGTVIISTEMTNTDHKIVVQDDGIGFDVNQPIENDDRNHIGIMNSKKRLKDTINGKLFIESEPNKGTVATITIPRHYTI